MPLPLRSQPRRRYWSAVKRLTLWLLLPWFVVSFGAPWFATLIDCLAPADFPLSYWMAAQGALVLFIAIVVIYGIGMDRIEAQLHREGRSDPDSAYQPEEGAT